MPSSYVSLRFRHALAALFTLLLSLGSISWEAPGLDPPEVFTVRFDAPSDPLGHDGAARIALRDRDLPHLLPRDHSQRAAAAGLIAASRA